MARTEADAALLGIAFLGVKDIYSADNSSPQTTELNAKKRAPTLMKWVNIAAVESAGIVVLLTAAAPPGHKRWPLFGGVLALAVTYGQYIYAKDCGLRSIEDGTEDYATPVASKHGGGMRVRGVNQK
jgi:hypothetical protein